MDVSLADAGLYKPLPTYNLLGTLRGLQGCPGGKDTRLPSQTGGSQEGPGVQAGGQVGAQQVPSTLVPAPISNGPCLSPTRKHPEASHLSAPRSSAPKAMPRASLIYSSAISLRGARVISTLGTFKRKGTHLKV